MRCMRRKAKGHGATHHNLGFIESVQRVQGSDRQFRVSGIDQQGKLDFRSCDGANIYTAFGEGPEGPGRDAGMAAHSDPDDRNLGHIGRAVEARIADLRSGVGYRVLGALEIGRRYRKGEVGGGAVRRYVLDDHVHVDVGVGQRAEDISRDARLVLDIADRNLRLVLGERDSGDDLLFHDVLLGANQGPFMWINALRRIEARSHEYAHLADHAEFDRADLKHLGAQRGKLEHFLECDPIKPPRLRHHARVGSIDAIDIGVDIAAIGLYGGRDRHRRGIRAAAAPSGDSAGIQVDTLEAGNDRDLLAFTEALDEFAAIDIEDARGCMSVGSNDWQLPTLPR